MEKVNTKLVITESDVGAEDVVLEAYPVKKGIAVTLATMMSNGQYNKLIGILMSFSAAADLAANLERWCREARDVT